MRVRAREAAEAVALIALLTQVAGGDRNALAELYARTAPQLLGLVLRMLHRRDVAEEILRFAKRQDADLIVMGGYGHSRMREWLLGGVTRTMLRRSFLCCLMSH